MGRVLESLGTRRVFLGGILRAVRHFLVGPPVPWVEEEMVAEPDISRFADDVADVGTDARSGVCRAVLRLVLCELQKVAAQPEIILRIRRQCPDLSLRGVIQVPRRSV
jgi:hypothetical protein